MYPSSHLVCQSSYTNLTEKLQNKALLANIHYRISKLRRKKEWRKQTAVKHRQNREERARKRDEMHAKIDAWRKERLEKEEQERKANQNQIKLQKQNRENDQLQRKHRELLLMIDKLRQLRELRREKAKREGIC
ncbi:hypothetical protein HDV00_007666 [Rhizophlyctis rosea]|nr:hypothetical protein HDV00_007666 [Rhizophlyctis rosea]